MKHFCLHLILLFLIITIQTSGATPDPNNEIIGKVNGDNLYLSDFNRLFNAQKKAFADKKVVMDKVIEKVLKDRLVDLMINELLAIQEAKSRNLQVSEEEITKRLNAIKEKQGGEEGFKKFLAANNATLEDAKNEIKKQALYTLAITELSKENTDLKSYMTKKKLKSTIVLYNDKIFPDEAKPTKPEEKTLKSQDSETSGSTDQQAIVPLRTEKYPTLTKSKVEELNKIAEETNKIAHELEEKAETSNKKKETKREKKNKLPSVPLLTASQQERLNLRQKQNLTVEEIAEPVQGKEEKITETTKVKEPVVLKPLNKGQKKKQKIKLSQSLKKNLNKIKLARLEKKNLRAYRDKPNLVPGEALVNDQTLVDKTQHAESIAKIPEQVYPPLRPDLQNPQAVIPNPQLPPSNPVLLPPGLPPSQPQQPQANFPPQAPPSQPLPPQAPNPQALIPNPHPAIPSSSHSVDLKTLNVFKAGGSAALQNIQTSKDLSKEAQELRKKIEERRASVKK